MTRKKTIPKEKIELKLLNKLNDLSLFNSAQIRLQHLPMYIAANLKHRLREYQFSAIQNLDAVEHIDKTNGPFNQLMFYMATGSGKTDIMAAIILYMFQKWNYQCFLFTTSTTAVVNKTIDNLTNVASPKYLYNDPIVINGQHITIKKVSEFPATLEKQTIYLKLSGIQQLSNDYYSTRENEATKDSLQNHKLVILADEAHHFNVGTRSKKENANSKSWEMLLDSIRTLNSDNLQLEFTATIDLHNPDIYHKYQNKIIAQYDLSKFINDGYSKRVYRLQANNSDEEKMLNAVLLSQYRKRIAQNMGIPNFKPVILFKSNSVKVSRDTKQHFLDMIDGLSVESLQSFVQSQNTTTQSEALRLAYQYWLKQDFAQTVAELKRDFREETTIDANDSGSTDILDKEAVRLNTLESPDNRARSVFAVAKLSEGWDVLNLYDIVRIGEKAITPKDTNAEAQLIGRGARYFPFIYKGKKSYTRRFDDRKPEIQLLERLYYHTINNPQYLENLRKSFDAINLPVNDDKKYKVFSAKVKPLFKRSQAYKRGNIYYNEVKAVPSSYYDSIQKYGFDPETTAPIDMIDITAERKYDTGADNAERDTTTLINAVRFSDPSDKSLIRTAMSFNPFFRFSKLKQQCPSLKSINEFLTSKDWLGHAVVQVRVANGTRLTPQQKLKALTQYLMRVQSALVNNFQRSRGTNVFKPVAIKEVIKDYDKRVDASFTSPSSPNIEPSDMRRYDWYVYDYAIVDGLEDDFIKKMGGQMDTILSKYKKAYLLRIDERNTDFKLHDFGGKVYHYAGYMPDFILYLDGESYIYQVYLEPKGGHLVNKDLWKEELLERISPENIKILGENDKVKLYGVKFYVEEGEGKNKTYDVRHMFNELHEKGIIPDAGHYKLTTLS